MSLNGCSKKACPMQAGTVYSCNLTKEQCPYFTQDIDVLKALNQIKADVAREIFEEIDKAISEQYPIYTADSIIKILAELKKKYMEDK